MATIKLGPIVAAIRGSVAGVTFSANRAGPFAKGWSRGADPQTTLQSDQRGRLGALAAAWRELSQADRDDWIVYAALPAQDRTNSLGETFSASGFNWFILINDHLEAADEARRDLSPTLTRPAAPILQAGHNFFKTTSGGLESRIRLDLTTPDLTFDHFIFARVTAQGRSAIAHGFKFQTFGEPDLNRRVFYQTEIEATFGTIDILQRVHLEVRSQDSDGQRSPKATLFVDAAN